MLRIIANLCSLFLAIYVVWDAATFRREYQRLKKSLADGDKGARSRLYLKIVVLEWLSALIAWADLQLDLGRLNPVNLGILETAFGRTLFVWRRHTDRGLIGGIVLGALIGALAMGLLASRVKRREKLQTAAPGPSRLQSLVPDFRALLPATARERWIFAAVAISAGICEEIVFRGWLLNVLHHQLGLNGGTMVGVAVAVFGLAHAYQGVPGIIATAAIGFVMCALYLASGSLVIPMVVHSLLDLRAMLFRPETG